MKACKVHLLLHITFSKTSYFSSVNHQFSKHPETSCSAYFSQWLVVAWRFLLYLHKVEKCPTFLMLSAVLNTFSVPLSISASIGINWKCSLWCARYVPVEMHRYYQASGSSSCCLISCVVFVWCCSISSALQPNLAWAWSQLLSCSPVVCPVLLFWLSCQSLGHSASGSYFRNKTLTTMDKSIG